MTQSLLRRIGVAAVLALPVLGLCGMVVRSEYRLHHGIAIQVPITGYDPTDPLQGHYLRYRFAWNWQGKAPEEDPDRLCITAAGENPQVRPLDGDDDDGACAAVLHRNADFAGFVPDGVTDELFVSEDKIKKLQQTLNQGNNLQVDLVVLPDHKAHVAGWSLLPIH